MPYIINDEFTNANLTRKQKFRLRHPKYDHQYYEKNKEHLKQYYQNHREKHRIVCKKWARKNREKIKEKLNRWRRNNPEKNKASYEKRRRNLGFVILWEPKEIIEPMQYHHINKIFVVLIPKRLHKLINHNIFSGLNMSRINDVAFNYIMEWSL